MPVLCFYLRMCRVEETQLPVGFFIHGLSITRLKGGGIWVCKGIQCGKISFEIASEDTILLMV